MVRCLIICPHCGKPIALEALDEDIVKPSPTWPAKVEIKTKTEIAKTPDMRRYGYLQHDEPIGMTGYEDSGDIGE